MDRLRGHEPRERQDVPRRPPRRTAGDLVLRVPRFQDQHPRDLQARHEGARLGEEESFPRPRCARLTGGTASPSTCGTTAPNRRSPSRCRQRSNPTSRPSSRRSRERRSLRARFSNRSLGWRLCVSRSSSPPTPTISSVARSSANGSQLSPRRSARRRTSTRSAGSSSRRRSCPTSSTA